jgi:hypothetical protein
MPPRPEGFVPRKKEYDRKKEIRAIARERVGTVPPSRPIQPKTRRARPKYKKLLEREESGT